MSKRKRRITLTRVTLAIIALLSLVAGWLVWQWYRRPAYWVENERYLAQQQQQLRDIAGTVEARVTGDLTRAGNNGERSTISFTFNEANAWLRTKLPQWAGHEGFAMPGALRDYMVAAEEGKPVVAFVLETQQVAQVISVRLDVRVQPNGRIFVRADDFRAGSISLPPQTLLDQLRGRFGASNDLAIFEQLVRGMEIEPVFKHPGHQGKNLRVVGFELTPAPPEQPDTISVTLEASWRSNVQ